MSRPSPFPRRTTGRRTTPLALLAITAVAAVTGIAAPQAAAAKDTSPRAITAMKSGVSELRRNPDGTQVTATERKAEAAALADASTGPLGSSDAMGPSPDKTLLESDDVFRETNVPGAAGNLSTVAAYSMQANMSAIDGSPAEATLAQRAVINHQYASHGAHLLDATHMGVLDFKQELAGGGSDSILALTSPNQSAETWTIGSAATWLVVGQTYVIKQSSAALTNAGVGASSPVHTQARSAATAAGTPQADQLWTMVDAGTGDGAFELVSRADGLCLARDGEYVSTDTCINDPSRQWQQFYSNATQELFIYPQGLYLDHSLGSDAGQGNASTLGANTDQFWTAYALNEPGGSVPSWSYVRPQGASAGHLATPMDMTTGDLDGVPTQDAQAAGPGGQGGLAYHDEAVVAYADSSNHLQVRVVDYNANPSHLLVTAPTDAKTISLGDGTNLGDVKVGIGDFDGGVGTTDGNAGNEIAVAHQGADGNFTIDLYRYAANADGTRSLALVKGGAQPFASKKLLPNLQTGYASMATGDFDGDGRSDIALAFATYASATNNDRYANLGIWTLNSAEDPATDLTTRLAEVTAMPTDGGTLPRALEDGNTWTQSGIQLVAGNLLNDPDNGFGPQRSELAVAYNRYYVGGVTDHRRPYTITPVFNTYKVSVSCATSPCTMSTDPINESTTMNYLFPSQRWAAAQREEGTSYVAPPLSLAVGAFGGLGDDDPKTDGLLASTWLEDWPSSTGLDFYRMSTIVVPKVNDDGTNTWTVTDTKAAMPGGVTYPGESWTLTHYTAYDRTGDSLVLGAPSVVTVEAQNHESLLAAEPPAHVDWLDGHFVNVSAGEDFSLITQSDAGQAFTTTASHSNSWKNTAKQGLDLKTTWATPNTGFAPTEKGSVDLNLKAQEQWGGTTQTSTSNTTTFQETASAKTVQDDSFSYSHDTWRLYRYPIIGQSGVVTDDDDENDKCHSPNTCRATYDVYAPVESVKLEDISGKSTTDFQPDWENLNALSYPAIDTSTSGTGKVPTPDIGSYTDDSGTAHPSSPLYNSWSNIDGNPGSLKLAFGTKLGTSKTTTSDFTWDQSGDLSISAKTSVGGWTLAGANATFGVTVSAGWDVNRATSDVTTGSQVVTSDSQFYLQKPAMDNPQAAYNVGTAYYYSKDGAARVVHGVDLRNNAEGQAWWIANYNVPDPSLNLPQRIDLTYDAGKKMVHDPVWRTVASRQLLRQFQVLQTQDDDSGLPTAGTPYATNPRADDKVVFQTMVHNYSLAAMTTGTTADWYAVPVDTSNYQVSANGTQIHIGQVPVPKIPAQGEVVITSPQWTALNDDDTDNQQYRIFVVLDEAGTLPADLHPLKGATGTAADDCDVSTLEHPDNTPPPPPLTDLRQGGTEALACGQNNQGYGLVTVSPARSTGVGAPPLGSPEHPANAQLAGGGLLGQSQGKLELTETSDVPTVQANARVSGYVSASSELLTTDQPTVAIYDGAPSDGKLIYVGHIPGISPTTGGAMPFDWVPTTPGLHELHQVLLGTLASGEDDEQIMRINVAAPPRPFSVTAKASATTLRHGQPFTVTGTVTPKSDAAVGSVQLQQMTYTGWRVVATATADARGRYSFAQKAPTEPGTYRYRAYKTAGAGRAGASSAEVKVAVDTFLVTAKAHPATIKTGERTLLVGSVAPTMAKPDDRVILVQVKDGERWRTVARSFTMPSGRFAVPVRPRSTGTFTYQVVKPAAAGWAKGTSLPVTVRVRKR